MNAQPEYAIVVADGQAEEQARRQAEEDLAKLYQGFAQLRDRWVQHRAASGVESRWRRANSLYHGDPEIDAAVTELGRTLSYGPSNKNVTDAPRSRVVVNIIRPKVEQAIARMCEILLPVDDRNWAIGPTPVPEIASRIGNQAQTVDPATGQPTGLTADQEAQAVIAAAKESSGLMQKSIDDNLTECGYNGECRKVLTDGVRLGSGVIKGPFPKKKRSKKWTTSQNVSRMEFSEEIVPSSERADPWDVYFDPSCGNDHQRGRGAFQRRPVTRKELRALVGLPGYDSEAIKLVLRTAPSRVGVAEGRVTRAYSADESYELWEYHGEIEPEDFLYLAERLGGSDDEPNPLTDVTSAVVVLVNDTIIGALPSWIEDGTLPYDVWNWRQSDDSPYGYGLPDELEHQQRVINAAWRQVMDNGRNSLGGQIIMRQGDIIPANGRYEMTPMKLWYAKDSITDVTKAFAVFEFASHIDELLKVAQAALGFSDLESGIPQLMGGENGGSSAPETVGGMLMLYNNANAVLRLRVKLYDDNVTRPHISRYYDFKMANDPDERIKGDCEVDARGSSALVERDIQNQAMINLAAITSNPRYAPHLKEREELKSILKAFRLNPDDLLKTEEQVAQEAEATPPQQDPRIVSAEMALKAKEMDIEDAKAQREFEAQRNATDNEFRNRQLAYNSQREQAEFEIAQVDSSIKRDTALLRENNAVQMSRETNASRERLGALKIETDREIFNAEAQLRVQTGEGI